MDADLRGGHDPQELRASFAALQAERPNLRARDAADRLGISEAELVALGADAEVTALRAEWGDIVRALPDLGTVMTLTRNDHAVHEKVGRYEEVGIHGPMGLVLGPDIDLRLFLGKWAFGYAVARPVEGGVRRSLQFFDAQGVAVHKVFLRDESSHAGYEALVERFRAAEQGGLPQTAPGEPATPDRDDAEIDAAGLRADWGALQDTHDFVKLLKAHNVGRVQALRLAGEAFAHEVPVGSFRAALETARDRQLEIMVFVGNPGCIQIHTGPVATLKAIGPWFNVLDPGFNLHLREDGITSAWVVRKPTADGVVTSLEIYDSLHRPIALMFGKRKPGEAELPGWRALAEELPRGSGADG